MRSLREARRGFTLVEVLVALTAGLMVSAAAYMLAQNAMRSFQDESRISSSQVGVALGLSRLTADLQRAGYMASPNVAIDPKLCESLRSGWAVATPPPIAAVQIRDGSSAMPTAERTAGGYDLDENDAIPPPDMLVISGNMTSAEQFEYRGIDGGTMHLAANRGPARRAYEDVGRDPVAFCEIFIPRSEGENPGRYARVVEPSGKESYVIVTDCTALPDPVTDELDKVELEIIDPISGAAPSTAGSTCGARPGGGLINPVSIIRYRVTRVTDDRFAPALAATGPNAVTGEDSRLELVREEIPPLTVNPFATDITPSSLELVTEFAVDLDLAAVVFAPRPTPDPADPKDLTYLATSVDNGAVELAAVPPQRFRSVRVRLGTRARVPDRDEAAPAIGVATRFLLPGVTARNRYARMRTLHADVTLPNLAQVTW